MMGGAAGQPEDDSDVVACGAVAVTVVLDALSITGLATSSSSQKLSSDSSGIWHCTQYSVMLKLR